MNWIRAALMMGDALTLQSPAAAQTQAQQDRLDRVAQFVVTAPMCERLGMKIDPVMPEKVESALAEETASWRVDAATVDRLKREAVSRQLLVIRTDLEAASSSAKTEAQLRNLRTVLLGYGRTCIAASSDPIFAKLIMLPPGYDMESAVTAASDAMLERGGLASWQSPRIQARGDLMMLAGTCRAKIGPARSDALAKEFGQSDDPRVRDHYRRSFDEGLADPTIVSTLAGCNRAIQQMRIKAR
ncbi:MAG TPA: hypothetical protein VF645_06455 [Allosphingosinicella sp.]|jgi:hypothetical protein